MDAILSTFVNTAVPLVVQLLAAALLAVLSAAALVALRYLKLHTTDKQRQLLYDFAIMAVNFAEKNGLEQDGRAKAKMAADYLGKLLVDWGVTTIKGVDVENSIEGAVETAWRNEIGATYRPPSETTVPAAVDDPAAPATPAAAIPVAASYEASSARH